MIGPQTRMNHPKSGLSSWAILRPGSLALAETLFDIFGDGSMRVPRRPSNKFWNNLENIYIYKFGSNLKQGIWIWSNKIRILKQLKKETIWKLSKQFGTRTHVVRQIYIQIWNKFGTGWVQVFKGGYKFW